MQEIHSIGGGSRLFDGGGGDRRLRPPNHQAVKCPRCASVNTKFCYYNNYNLSQPRHFCKACRRYWTNGGVLRNVPVGGGCRKTTKRSKPKQTASTAAGPANTTPPSESHSSSESSSLTAAVGNSALEVVSANSSSSASKKESKLLNSNLQDQGSDCGIFSEIRSFSSMINSTNDQFGFGDIMSQQDRDEQWQQPPPVKEEMKLHESMTGGFIDQTADVELSGLQGSGPGNGGGFGTLDWQGTGDQGLFDLPNSVHHSYWNQSQWTDQDQYLP